MLCGVRTFLKVPEVRVCKEDQGWRIAGQSWSPSVLPKIRLVPHGTALHSTYYHHDFVVIVL